MNKTIVLQIKTFFSQYGLLIILFLIFCLHVFLRFYDMENRNYFTWDQVDNAWAVKGILIDHKYPLTGMVAKLNSGFSIGPFYYYLITPAYWFFHLDPIASGVIAGLTSIFTFFVLFYITKKIFSMPVALILLFIHAVSSYIIILDRTQWPVNFVVPISAIIFYCLYEILSGNCFYILILSLAIGFSFHIHFTAVFFVIIAFLSLPFFPRKLQTLKYILFSLPLFLVWFIPNIISELSPTHEQSNSLLSYTKTYNHGFHLVRFMQIIWDAFIEFEGILFFRILKSIELFLFPIFFILSYFSPSDKKKTYILSYLMILWLLVPWIVFALYSGEISNYYFSLTRPIVLMIISYLIWQLFKLKSLIPKIIVVLMLGYYAFYNLNFYFHRNTQGIGYHRQKTLQRIKNGEQIPFTQGDPESYMYYIYVQLKN